MSWRNICLGLSLLVLTLPAAALEEHFDGGKYVLGPGDVVQIRVFGEPDLSLDAIRLDDSGFISYPFLGQVNASGLTTRELEERLKSGLDGDYLINPRVAISVAEYREFYVNGEVRRPGGYAWQPGLTMRQAISLAGGMTERGSTRRMTVIRENDPERTSERVEMDSLIFPGDIIDIRQGLF